MKHTTSLDNYMAVLLARAECRGNDAAIHCCDMFLRMYPVKQEPSFIELSQPKEQK